MLIIYNKPAELQNIASGKKCDINIVFAVVLFFTCFWYVISNLCSISFFIVGCIKINFYTHLIDEYHIALKKLPSFSYYFICDINSNFSGIYLTIIFLCLPKTNEILASRDLEFGATSRIADAWENTDIYEVYTVCSNFVP